MTLLELRDVSLVDEDQTVLRGVHVTVERGEKLVVFGRSGAGKRTFLKLAAGVLGPSSGSVRLHDPRPGRRIPVGYVTHHGGLLSNLTLLQNAILPTVYHKALGSREAERRARALFDGWGLASQAERRPASVSAAARRLVDLARALLSEPALFVLDDPLEDMDAATTITIRKALDHIMGQAEASVIVGTERPGPYLDLGKRFLLIRGGGVRIFESRRALLQSDDPEVRLLLEKPLEEK